MIKSQLSKPHKHYYIGILVGAIFIFLFNYKAPKTSSSESVKGQDSGFEVILIKGTIKIIMMIIIVQIELNMFMAIDQ